MLFYAFKVCIFCSCKYYWFRDYFNYFHGRISAKTVLKSFFSLNTSFFFDKSTQSHYLIRKPKKMQTQFLPLESLLEWEKGKHQQIHKPNFLIISKHFQPNYLQTFSKGNSTVSSYIYFCISSTYRFWTDASIFKNLVLLEMTYLDFVPVSI